MGNIFGNNLLMQYLSAAGAAMSEGKPIASALNPITQQNIAAQSKIKAQNAYLEQLSGMLKTAGGKEGKSAVSFGADGSMNVKLDSDRLTSGDNVEALRVLLSGPGLTDDKITQGGTVAINNPAADNPDVIRELSTGADPSVIQSSQGLQSIQSLIGQAGGSSSQQMQIPSMQTNQKTAEEGDEIIQSARAELPQANPSLANMVPSGGNIYNMLMRQMLNPQISPVSMSNADLAGLTPQDLSQALSGQLAMEEMRQRQLTGVSDMAHRQWTESKTKDDPDAQPYMIPVEGRQVSVRQWKELPNSEKEYQAYKFLQTQENPKEPLMNRKEFKMQDKETRIGYLRELQNNPDLLELDLLRKKSGATNISMDPGERAEKTTIGTSAGKMQSGDFMQGVREDLMKDKERWYDPPMYKELKGRGMDDTQATAKAREIMLIEETDKRVRAQYPDSKVLRLGDGWYVDGKLKVRYTP